MFYLKINPAQKIPIVYLHGFLGHHKNWLSVAKRIDKGDGAYLLDFRNHGKSPYFDSHSYWDLAEDLLDFLKQQSISRCHLVGHSMGGKVALLAALRFPELIEKMVVLEISPWNKRPPLKIVHSMSKYPLEQSKNFEQIKNDFLQMGFQKEWAQYLATTIKKNEDGKFSWNLNLQILKKYQEHILGYQVPFEIGNRLPVLFIRSYKSQYLSHEDNQRLKSIFPNAQFRLLPVEGHNPHMEYPELIANILNSYLRSPRAGRKD